MLYLKKFENHSSYTAQQASLITPNVSYCNDVNDVHYKQKIPDNSVLFMCDNIQPNTTEEVKIQYSTSGAIDTITVDKNNKLYKQICKEGFHRIYSTKDIISSVTLNAISNINNSGQFHWFPTNVQGVSIKDCTIGPGSQLINMCSGCTNLTSFEAINFDVKNATSMENAFSNCSNLVYLDLSGLNKVYNIKNMKNLFNGCQKLKTIDISTWDLQSPEAIDTTGIFGTDVNSCVGNGSFEIIVNGRAHYTKLVIEKILSDYNIHGPAITCKITEKE